MKKAIEEAKNMRNEYDINDPYYNTQREVLYKLIERLEAKEEEPIQHSQQPSIDILDNIIGEWASLPLRKSDQAVHTRTILREARDKIQSIPALIPQEPSINGWIPVTDRLPEEDMYVLVYDGGIEVAAYKGYGVFDDGDYNDNIKPTHWQPLPNPPQEEPTN